MGVEPADGAIPGQIGHFLVIARGRIIVKAVIGPIIDMRSEGLAVGFQRGFVIGPARIDALVEGALVKQQGSLNSWHVIRLGLASVERHRGAEFRVGHGQSIAHAVAIAETNSADLSG
jgi:hypothetical protein